RPHRPRRGPLRRRPQRVTGPRRRSRQRSRERGRDHAPSRAGVGPAARFRRRSRPPRGLRAIPASFGPGMTTMETPVYAQLGMTEEEYRSVISILGREPRPAELAMYSVMWSEHCSYKSSRAHLRRFPTEAPWVVVGPGENAGVGGILRDVFTMGARPVALWNQIRFGPLDQPRNRYLFNGVVGGIAGYGNAVGVPTLGGEIEFDDCYSGNPLVNVMCLGILRKEQLVLGTAGEPGNVAVLLGAATGRDGIGGASVLASA